MAKLRLPQPPKTNREAELEERWLAIVEESHRRTRLRLPTTEREREEHDRVLMELTELRDARVCK